MKPVVLDTNILLDIFVFDDERAKDLKKAIIAKEIDVVASTKTIEELMDVIARPVFELQQEQQLDILTQWKSCARMVDDSSLSKAPWVCGDADDQLFLDMAYTLKPAVIISKDNDLLRLASKAITQNILISNDYQAFNP